MDLNLAPSLAVREVGAELLVAVSSLVCALNVVGNKNFFKLHLSK